MSNLQGGEAGWKLDPDGAFHYRFWTGNHWTADVSTDGLQRLAPLLDTSDPLGSLARGNQLENAGELNGAEREYVEADGSGNPEGSAALGVLLRMRGANREAADAYRRAAEGGIAWASCNLAVVLEEFDDLAGAEEAYRRADNAGFAGGAYGLGQLAHTRNDFDAALRWNLRADELGDGEGSFNAGVLFAQRGDYENAAKLYDRAYGRGPLHAEAAVGLGRAREKLGNIPAALQAFHMADELGSPNGSYDVGRLHVAQDDLSTARTYMSRASERGHTGAPEILALIDKQLQQESGTTIGQLLRDGGYLNRSNPSAPIDPFGGHPIATNDKGDIVLPGQANGKGDWMPPARYNDKGDIVLPGQANEKGDWMPPSW